jgi:ribose 5-phosphate isomerase B
MPNIKSAKKRVKIIEKKTLTNNMIKSAYKFKGIRCAKCDNEEEAKYSKMHNNSNVLALGADYIETDEAIRIVRMWLATEFEGGRHQERIQMIDEIETENMK